MRKYKVIPFEELRHQYRRERKFRKGMAGFIEVSALAAIYGAMIGLMITGLWTTL